MKLFIVLHHTDDPRPVPQFDGVNEYHKRKGFPRSSFGYHVGYHYFIGTDGTVKQAREESEVGAHCNAKLMNYVGIGICLAGDFTQHRPDHRQIAALERLVTGIQTRWPIPDEAILLHRECKPTACPGIDLRRLLLDERSKADSQPDVPDGVRAALARRLARRIRRRDLRPAGGV